MTAPAMWQHAFAARLSDGNVSVTLGFARNGLLHIEYTTAGGYRIRQVCSWSWFVERMLGRDVDGGRA